MPLIVMVLSHDTFSEGGRKTHLGCNHLDFAPERTFCGIKGAFALIGPESINEQWINQAGNELCQKCAKAALSELRQQAKAGE